jgi:hypothetical protein
MMGRMLIKYTSNCLPVCPDNSQRISIETQGAINTIAASLRKFDKYKTQTDVEITNAQIIKNEPFIKGKKAMTDDKIIIAASIYF